MEKVTIKIDLRPILEETMLELVKDLDRDTLEILAMHLLMEKYDRKDKDDEDASYHDYKPIL